MMSLEEIIKALTKCDGNCGGGCEFSGAYGCNVMFVLKGDILHHLKGYRQTIKYLEVQHDHVEQLCEYFKNNPPLTWDELQAMKGKPVWLEYNFLIADKEIRDKSKRWCIIGEFKPWKDTEITITENGFVLSKREQIKHWQAYRREK